MSKQHPARLAIVDALCLGDASPGEVARDDLGLPTNLVAHHIKCPYFPGKRYEDWKLDDPAGKGVESVRPIRDEIKTRIEGLARRPAPGELTVASVDLVRIARSQL